MRKKIAKGTPKNDKDGGFLNITTIIEPSAVSEEQSDSGTEDYFGEQLRRTILSSERPLKVTIPKRKPDKKEAEIGNILFNSSLINKAKLLKSRQALQSGVSANKDEIISSKFSPGLENNTKPLIIDHYKDFDENKKEEVDDNKSRKSKLKSEEQGRNISSEFNNPNINRTLEEQKVVKEIRKKRKIAESMKEVPKSPEIVSLRENSIPNINKSLDEVKLEDHTTFDSKIFHKELEESILDISKDNFLLPKSKKGKRDRNMNINLNDSFLNNEQSALDRETLNYELFPEEEWKKTPLYIIFCGENKQEDISTLLDIKHIDLEKA